jgi:hypothetical protein
MVASSKHRLQLFHEGGAAKKESKRHARQLLSVQQLCLEGGACELCTNPLVVQNGETETESLGARRQDPRSPKPFEKRYFTTKKLPMTRASIPELKKVRMASVGVQTIASPRRLNDVFMTTGTPVRLPNSSIRRQ